MKIMCLNESCKFQRKIEILLYDEKFPRDFKKFVSEKLLDYFKSKTFDVAQCSLKNCRYFGVLPKNCG